MGFKCSRLLAVFEYRFPYPADANATAVLTPLVAINDRAAGSLDLSMRDGIGIERGLNVTVGVSIISDIP